MEDMARGKHRRGSTVQRPDSLLLEVEETEQLAVREEEREGKSGRYQRWRDAEAGSWFVRNASPRRLCGTLTECVGALQRHRTQERRAKNRPLIIVCLCAHIMVRIFKMKSSH